MLPSITLRPARAWMAAPTLLSALVTRDSSVVHCGAVTKIAFSVVVLVSLLLLPSHTTPVHIQTVAPTNIGSIWILVHGCHLSFQAECACKPGRSDVRVVVVVVDRPTLRSLPDPPWP